jgi:hypothetical protein
MSASTSTGILSVALYSVDRGLLTTWIQPARPELLIERLRPIRGAVVQVAYEAADGLRPGPPPAGRGLPADPTEARAKAKGTV